MKRLAWLILLLAVPVHADDELSSQEILGTPSTALRVESAQLRYTHFDQDGHGYQSQAERASPWDPGREKLTVEQVQG